MSFDRKIYYQNKPLVLTNDALWYIHQNPVAAGYFVTRGAFPRNFRLAFDHLDGLRSMGAIIQDISIDALLEGIHKIYKPIDAAGGVVQNEKGEILLIYRRGHWDLPKGKLDEGEELSNCALREVMEETGLRNLALGERICETFHIYSQMGDHLLKRTTWYHMQASSKEILMPQAEENIELAQWMPKAELGSAIFKSFKAIREVLNAAGITW